MKYERGWKARKGIKILCCVVAFVAIIGFVVMSLWNWLVPTLFHGPIISFWQAFGLFVLSKLLLSGGKSGHWGWRGREHWREKMRDKLAHMSEEERNKLRENFRKCGFNRDRFRDFGNHFRDRERGQYREPGFPFDDDKTSPAPPPEPGSDMA
ncbi:hypothetical protein GA0116948_103305 [Chitinophaga costaii]|uniref:Uncharacterized protein n=1 Tax=Chitinophaga costaii TaxID=1335309 RepID=A0A1C4BXU7_9BACT|nr:hypothetical protein [Chitinophaga costaii]SCC11729.1 hypothetical protein GA0116948_103305 [Chitinophaga costaii]